MSHFCWFLSKSHAQIFSAQIFSCPNFLMPRFSHAQIFSCPDFWSSTDIELVFSGEMSKASLDCVLCYRDTIALKTPKSREKNEGRRYFDYCGITTTEYKWTTRFFIRSY